MEGKILPQKPPKEKVQSVKQISDLSSLEQKQNASASDKKMPFWKIMMFITLGLGTIFIILLVVLIILLTNPPANLV